MDPLIKYECKIHGHAQISKYEILSLYFVIKYSQGTKNIILDYISVTHFMSCVEYKYKGKLVIVHMIIIIKRYVWSQDILVT